MEPLVGRRARVYVCSINFSGGHMEQRVGKRALVVVKIIKVWGGG